MAEVAEVRQPHAAVGEDLRDLSGVEPGRGRGVRPVVDEEEDERAADDREAETARTFTRQSALPTALTR